MNNSFLPQSIIESLQKRGGNSVRFAPSPTGHFHVGNFRTALFAQAWAERLKAPLWVRYEDIDQERSSEEHLKAQMRELSFFGIESLPLDVQSARLAFFETLFVEGVRKGFFYPCVCSRKQVDESLLAMQSAPHHELPLYSGLCRHLTGPLNSEKPTIGWRFKDPNDQEGRQDFLVAKTSHAFREGNSGDLSSIGFQPSYHFACAIDDYFSDCALIVRAWDLKSSVIPQRKLMKVFSNLDPSFVRGPLPAVFHTALVTDDGGHRLEKRTRGVTLNELLKKYQLSELKKLFFDSISSGAAWDFEPAKIWGEAKKTLTLSQFGLK